jgi:hypothetical protein
VHWTPPCFSPSTFPCSWIPRHQRGVIFALHKVSPRPLYPTIFRPSQILQEAVQRQFCCRYLFTMGNNALNANGFTNTVTVDNHITVRGSDWVSEFSLPTKDFVLMRSVLCGHCSNECCYVCDHGTIVHQNEVAATIPLHHGWYHNGGGDCVLLHGLQPWMDRH